MALYKIGVTEAGDAGVDLSWEEKIDDVDAAVLITKRVSPDFFDATLRHKNNDQPLCRFAVIHISFSSFSPKAKVRIRHYARKPEARYAGGFFLLLTRFASNAREFWFTTNAYAHRLRELEKRPMRKAVTVKRWG